MLLFQLLIGGIAQGCIYGLLAMGVVLIYQSGKTISLVQGEFMMLGAWLGLVCTSTWDLPYGLAVCAALMVVAILGWATQQLLIRPLKGRPAWVLALLPLAVIYSVRKQFTAWTGSGLSSSTLPSPYQDDVWVLAGVPLLTEHAAAITITTLVCLVFFALIRFSKVGFALHAAMRNRLAAHHMGLPVRYLDGAVWALASVLAAVAGLLLATWAPVDADIAFVGLKALPAVLIGGLSHLRGALIGGLLIGVVEALASPMLSEQWQDIPGYLLALMWWAATRRCRCKT